ncbi:MAG: phosphoglycerate dehydrogenase [Planctomycetes bacterium]|jgi:D-3-phosphoglycerate dehydrogenase|nr:phosphoglycerate dehydrogenase [Planctomycetota bacterium]
MAETIKILVADKLSPVGLKWLEEQNDVELTNLPGRDPEELKADLGNYDGIIIRSGVKLKGDMLDEPGRLKGIARAGVGVDNIDIPLATKKGIIVMNTPDGNTLSTAELALTLMMALSRKIASANASLRSGAWDRKKFQGTQLAGKTLGVIGMGRIGRAVAQRAHAMEMRVLAYDPFFAGAATDGTFEMVKDLDELCKRADYITVHVPKSDDTLGMIGKEQIDAMKDNVRLVNAARGGIIDPEALLEGLNSGKVAGAALDVYLKEPPENEAEKALTQHDNVLAVPHLGASTEEAQEQVAVDAAQQLVEALRGGEVRNAVNAPGFGEALPDVLQPYSELATRLGMLLAGITPGAINKVEVAYRGAIGDFDCSPLTTYLLVGLIQPHMDTTVNVINAPVLAKSRGVEVDQTTSGKPKEFSRLMEVKVTTDKGERSAKGTIFGNKYPRVIDIDGYPMEMRPEGHTVVLQTLDKPGALSAYTAIFARHEINIADLSVSRKIRSGRAMVGLNVDQKPHDEVLKEVGDLDVVESCHYMKLPDLLVPGGSDE